MNIINYKDLDKIVPQSSIMLYCTCAEKNQQIYFKKIEQWYKHYSNFSNTDFYVFNDGKILNKNFPFDNRLTFIEFDQAFGRSNVCVFQGWKRSFAYATKLGQKYKYFCHIENDCYIKDILSFYKIITTDKYVGFPQCINYKMIETGCMVINDKTVLQNVSDVFMTRQKQYENRIFEYQLQDLLLKYENIGNGIRMECAFKDQDPLSLLSKDDVFCLNQVSIENLKKLNDFYLTKP